MIVRDSGSILLGGWNFWESMLQQRIHVDKGVMVIFISFNWFPWNRVTGRPISDGFFVDVDLERPRLEHQKRDPTQKLWRLKLSKSINIWQKQTLQKHLSSIKNPSKPLWLSTILIGWIGILILAYHNPYITGWDFSTYITQPTQGWTGHCSHTSRPLSTSVVSGRPHGLRATNGWLMCVYLCGYLGQSHHIPSFLIYTKILKLHGYTL